MTGTSGKLSPIFRPTGLHAPAEWNRVGQQRWERRQPPNAYHRHRLLAPRRASAVLHMFASYLAVLTVALIYYAWRDGYQSRFRQRTMLNERVAYMLWVAANRA